MSAAMHKQTPPSLDGHLELKSLLPRLRPFQREGFDFATKKTNGRLLICDEMGLGKTVTSLAVMLAFKEEWPLLILCPASLRYTWPAEIEKFIPQMPHSAIYVVRGFDDCDFHSNPIKRARIKVVVATYSLLQNRSAAAKALQEFSFKCVIADESHNLKEKTSQRCKIAMPLISGAKRVLLLSGTPALAKPVELWAQLNCVDQDLFGSYTSFTKKYCNARRGRFGYDVSGLSNADELHEKLKQVMIRRLKADVLKDLPPKQRSIVPVKILKNEHVKECRRIIAEMNETRASISSLAGEEANNAHFEGRSLLMQAYQASGIGKAQAVAEYVLDWLRGSGTQKVLVFAHHKEVLDTIEATISKHFKGVGHIRIDGSVNSAERAARVRKFQNKAQVRLGLLSITAAGVGLTLTAASSVIFAELHWTPGVLAQAEDRCHRIGQVNAVNIMYCVCKDTDLSVDPALWKMLGKKVSNLGRMIDGQKGASMNAVDTENGAPSEQELSSFFAETCATKGSPDVKGPIVKGSIQSFFKKPPTKNDAAISSSSGLKASSSISKFSSRHATRPTSATANRRPMRASLASKSNPFTSASGLKRKIDNPSWVSPTCKIVPQSTKSPTSDQQFSWTCEVCTFINEDVTSESGISQCLVCKSRRYQKSSVSVDLSQSSIDTTQSLSIDQIDLTQSPTNKAKQTPKSCTSSQSEIIEICDDSDDDDDDDDDDNLRHSPFATVRSKCPTLESSQKISPIVNLVLDQDNHNTLSTTKILSFTVSKNSGRIAVYLSNTGESLLINFDYENLIHESTSEELQNRQLRRKKRRHNDLEPDRVLFDDIQVRKVARNLRESVLSTKSLLTSISIDNLSTEIKQFITTYLTIREVEKKAIQEWDTPIRSDAIRETLRSIVQSSQSLRPESTERYSGGSKERALENVAAGNATDTDRRVLNGEACIWCAASLPDVALRKGVESYYCSQDCAEKGRLRRGGMYSSTRVRSQVFTLENGICQICRVDANALFLRISALQPAERLNALMNANWTLPKSSKALQNLLQNPKEGDFWQADHIKAVAEGGGSCGLENLRTLCTPCHQVETERLRCRLKIRNASDVGSSTKVDIRSHFKRRKKPSAD